MKTGTSSICRRLVCVLAGIFLFHGGATAQLTAPPAGNAPAVSPPAAEEDIRGPREPVEIPVPDKFSLTPWLVGASVLAAAGLLFWWWKYRRSRQREMGPVDRALGALEEIDRERNSMEAAELADRAADIVRRLIAEKFGIAAPRQTTEEFLHAVSTDPSSPLGGHTPLLRGFLKSCDMAKFAGADFDAAERLELLAGAFRFVRAATSSATSQPALTEPHAV